MLFSKKTNSILGTTVAFSLAIGAPSQTLAQSAQADGAQTPPSGELTEAQQTTNEIARETLRKARAEATLAEQNAARGAFTGLGNLTGGGSHTVGGTGGTLETNNLASLMIRQAGRRVHEEVAKSSTNLEGRNVLLLARDQELSFLSATSFLANLAGLRGQFEALGGIPGVACETAEILDPRENRPATVPPPTQSPNSDPTTAETPGEPATGNTESVTAVLGVVNLVAGMLTTNTDLRGTTAASEASTLITAIAGRGLLATPTDVTYINPSAVMVGPRSSGRQSVIAGNLNKTINAVRDCTQSARAKLAGLPPKVSDRDENDKRAAIKLPAAIAASETFFKAYFLPTATGAPRIGTVLGQLSIADKDFSVLRVNIDYAHGSVLTRRNLITALGGRAISVTGGVSVTYELTNPSTGEFIAAGLITCNTNLVNMRDAQEVDLSRDRFSCTGDAPPLDGEDGSS